MKFKLLNLKGGFGNQLFQLAFVNYLKNNKTRVYINTNFFKFYDSLNNTKRDLIVNLDHFKLKESSRLLNFIFRNLEVLFNSSTLMKIFPKNNNFIFRTISDKDINNLKSKNSIFTIYDGYWQKYKYINYSKKYLIQSLSQNKLILDSIQFPKVHGSTLIHVRRQDYLKLNQELGVNYYKRAINQAREIVKDFHFTVFTDDIEWVNAQNIFNEATKIYSSKTNETKNDVILTFSKMLRFENFIIANSSFSYMAAFLGSTKISLVIYPDPWFKSSIKDITFDNKWLKIKQ